MSGLDDLYLAQAQALERLEAKELRKVLEIFAKSRKGLVGELVSYYEDGLISPANQAVREATQALIEAFNAQLEYSITDAAVLGQDHLLALGRAAYQGSGVDMSIFRATLRGVPESVVNRALTRIWSDGLNLKARVWQMEAALRTQLEKQLAIGISQGRSIKLLARDIANTYDQVQNWQALRLARTETMAAYREAYVESGKGRDWIVGYRWVLSNAEKSCDVCEDLAGEYAKEEVPQEDESHPNCMCTLQAILQDRDQFIESLKDSYAL